MIRLGGDEFGVYAVGITDREMGQAIVSRLFDRLQHLRTEGIPDGIINVSAGAVIHTEDNTVSFADLYACSDRAMYLSKKSTGSNLTFGTM